MKQTINLHDFRNAFLNSNERKEQFSYEALEVLFNYYEEIDKDMEFDMIAICCEWTESSIEDALKAYDMDNLREIESATTVLPVDDETILYVNF